LREERRLRVFESNKLFRPYIEEETCGVENCIKKRAMLRNSLFINKKVWDGQNM
jgi:hypothetical protein